MTYQLEDLFLDSDSLRTWFLYFCQANSESLDPITDVLALFLGLPIQFTLSKNGLYIFEDSIPIPFSIMSNSQKHLLYHIVSSFRADEHTFSDFNLSDPLTYVIVNENIVFTIKKKKLDAKKILKMLLKLIHNSSKPSLTLFNIIIQRLHCRVAIDKDTLLYANEASKLIFT